MNTLQTKLARLNAQLLITKSNRNKAKIIIEILKEFDYINSVLMFQSNRYNLTPIDCEDSRNCDLVRYFQEYQSKYHIRKNNGKVMRNNSILKKKWGLEEYYKFSNKLK